MLRACQGRAEECAGAERGIAQLQTEETRISLAGETKRTDGPVGGGSGHYRQKRCTIGGVKQATVWFAAGVEHDPGVA